MELCEACEGIDLSNPDFEVALQQQQRKERTCASSLDFFTAGTLGAVAYCQNEFAAAELSIP